MTEPYVLRVTFGVQYSEIPHPHLEWAHPEGWFEIVVLGVTDPNEAYEVARDLAFRTTLGVFAFAYSPESWAQNTHRDEFHPLGALARLTFDARTATTTFEVFRRFRPTMKLIDDE